MVARDDDEGDPQPPEEARCALVLLGAAAVREVAARDDELGLGARHERRHGRLDLGILTCARVEVGEVQNPSWHSRCRL